VVLTQHSPESADHVFLNACRVSMSQQYQWVHHKKNIHLLEGNLLEDIWIASFENEGMKHSQDKFQHLKIKKY
jgi:hypothetical protein